MSITKNILHQKLKFAKQHTNMKKNDYVSRYYFLTTKLGKRNRLAAALTSQWVVLMEQKYVN